MIRRGRRIFLHGEENAFGHKPSAGMWRRESENLQKFCSFMQLMRASRALSLRRAAGKKPRLPIGKRGFCCLFACSADFFDLCRRARSAAQIVQFCPAYLALADNGDVCDLGRMHGERALHPYAVGQPADGERLADAAVFLRDHDAFKRLQPLARALDDLHAYLHGVAYVECGNALFEVFFLDRFDKTFHSTLPPSFLSVRGCLPEDRPKSFAILP